MFKCQEDTATVLGICVDEPHYHDHFDGMNYLSATSGSSTMEMLHLQNVDFVLVSVSMPDMSVWEFLRDMRHNFPHQKWALVGGPINDHQEINARSMGATTIFDVSPSSYELGEIVAHQRRQAARHVLAGQAPRIPSPFAAASHAGNSNGSAKPNRFAAFANHRLTAIGARAVGH